MNRRIRVAVVGIGEIATRAHIPAYLSNKYVDLIALVDIDRKKVEKATKKFGVKQFYSSVDELFEKQEVDAVSVCTPPSTHEDIALKALGFGAHVLCEKPLATTVDGGKRMVRASQKEKKILMVGFNRRFWPTYQQAKKLISKGRLGHVYCAMDHVLSSSPLLGWGKSHWFYEPGVGGALLDLGPHVFDMLNYILGDFPVAVSAFDYTHLYSPVEEFCVCVLEYPDERVGVGLVSWLSSTYVENLNILGTAQNLFVSPDLLLEANPTDILPLVLWGKVTKLLFSLKFPDSPLSSKKVDTYALEVNHFVKQIMDNRGSSQDAMNALNVVITCEGARKALETNRRIEISSLKEV